MLLTFWNKWQNLVLFASPAMGTFLFESRLGLFGPKPASEAQEFIHNLKGLFKLMQTLLYNLPVYKYFPTKTWKEYEQYCDNVFRIGRSYINKVSKCVIHLLQWQVNDIVHKYKNTQTTISKYYLDHRIYVLLKGIHVINTGEKQLMWTICLLQHTCIGKKFV